MPTKCSGVPESILNPANQWADKAEFDSTLQHLADLYEVRRTPHLHKDRAQGLNNRLAMLIMLLT